MPIFTVLFRFTESPQGDVQTYTNIEAPSKQRAIEIATEHLEREWPKEASSPYEVNCMQDQ
jgi:hypothetical protein